MPYERLYLHVWRRLEEVTGLTPTPLPDSRGGLLASFCPVCHDGVLVVEFLDDPARVRFRSDALGRCSDGCAAERIKEALRG